MIRILWETVNKGKNDVAIEQQPLALAGMCHIGELIGGDIELFSEDLSVACGLIEHINEIAVLQNVL